jgi:acyl-CoA synthetase (AMP-forming)/AMP-acid ligase II/acyl carrier protein
MSDSFAQTVWRQIGQRSRYVFLQQRDASFSYRQLADAIRHWCAVFDAHSVPDTGSRVVIVYEDELTSAALFLAALLDGKVPVMLNPDSRLERIAAVCRVTEPALAVVKAPKLRAALQSQGFATVGASEEGGVRKTTLLGRLRRPGRDQAPSRAPALRADAADLAYLLFTSGTTGQPSGVEITHGALQAHMATLTRLFQYNSGSCIANSTPLSHTDGLTQGLLLAAGNGARLLRPGRFSLDDLEGWLDQFARHGATHLITNPTVIALIQQFAAHSDYFSHDGFKAVISSAAILHDELWRAFERRFQCRLFNLYGMTETVANATYAGDHPEMGAHGTIGLPIDCEARVVDPADGVTPTDGVGELQLRGDNICCGYWRNPERSRRAFLAGGWFRTGDLVRRYPDGSLVFVGRLKSMINAGGLTIVPEEIDEALLCHPAVSEAVTVGLPHAEFEEIPVSAVVLDREIAPELLLAHAREHLEPLKVPRHIVAVERIPRGDAGKPDLARVKARLQQRLQEHEAERSPGTQKAVSIDEVIQLAARVFNVEADSLSSRSAPGTLQAWDSFNHLTLMLEAEAAFGRAIPTAKIAAIRSLQALHEAIVDE